jgi:hypothetical protein
MNERKQHFPFNVCKTMIMVNNEVLKILFVLGFVFFFGCTLREIIRNGQNLSGTFDRCKEKMSKSRRSGFRCCTLAWFLWEKKGTKTDRCFPCVTSCVFDLVQL